MSRPGLRLVSLNVASGIDRQSWSPGLDRVGTGLGELDADVVAVQEVDHLLPRTGSVDQTAALGQVVAPDGRHRFAAAIHGTPGDRATFGPSRVDARPDEPSYGVALLSRHDVTVWRELRMPAGRARLPVAVPGRLLLVPDEPRIALAAVVSTPLGPLSVVCTHLSFSPPHAVHQLLRLAAWTATLPRPLVLMGDLNLPGPVPAAITRWRRLLRAPTFPAGRPRVQLDHVLLDDPAGVVRLADARTVAVAGSDHLATVVDLLAPGETKPPPARG